MTAKKVDNLSRYVETQNYKKLVKKHSLVEDGIWEVLGEDPNPAFTGYHHNPRIGIYSGRLRDVLTIAVNLKDFWIWGSGGMIIKVNPVNVSPVDADAVLDTQEKHAAVVQQLDEIKKKMSHLEKSLADLSTLIEKIKGEISSIEE